MRRKGMLSRIIVGSLRHRAQRVAVAALSVAMGASLVCALADISLDVGGKAGKELRSYGANVALTPKVATGQAGVGGMQFGVVQEERYLEQSHLAPLDDWSGGEIMGYAPYLSATASVDGNELALVGTNFDSMRALRPWWSVTGEWGQSTTDPTGPVPAMVGVETARKLRVQTGDELTVRRGDREIDARVRGIVETGGEEDRQLFVPLTSVQGLLGKPGMLNGVDVSAVAEHRPLQQIAAEMERRIPGARARVVGQIADAEASALGKVRALMGLVAALVLLASGLAVASTMAASVMERTREIGLMKALGAGSTRVALVFLGEAVVIALLGSGPGYLLGIGLTQVIGQLVFGSGITPNLLAVPLTVAVVLVTCLVASLLPIRRALMVDPASTLRGE